MAAIAWLACLDAIYIDSIYCNLNKACYFDGISNQFTNVSIENIDICYVIDKTGLTCYEWM